MMVLLSGCEAEPRNPLYCRLCLPNQFFTWEGEAPAEPMRRQLGRSLALPLFFKRVTLLHKVP